MNTLTIHLPSTVEDASNLIAEAYDYDNNNKVYGEEKTFLAGETLPATYKVVSSELDSDNNVVSTTLQEYTIISKEEFAKNKTWEVLTDFYEKTAELVKQKAKDALLNEATKSIDAKISQISIPTGGSLEINKG